MRYSNQVPDPSQQQVPNPLQHQLQNRNTQKKGSDPLQNRNTQSYSVLDLLHSLHAAAP